MDVQVKTVRNDMYRIPLTAEASVGELKQQMVQRLHQPANLMRLIYRGRVLNDEKKLAEYGVQSGHIVHIVVSQPARPNPHANGTETFYDAHAPREDDAGPATRLLEASEAQSDGNSAPAQNSADRTTVVVGVFPVLELHVLPQFEDVQTRVEQLRRTLNDDDGASGRGQTAEAESSSPPPAVANSAPPRDEEAEQRSAPHLMLDRQAVRQLARRDVQRLGARAGNVQSYQSSDSMDTSTTPSDTATPAASAAAQGLDALRELHSSFARSTSVLQEQMHDALNSRSNFDPSKLRGLIGDLAALASSSTSLCAFASSVLAEQQGPSQRMEINVRDRADGQQDVPPWASRSA